MKLIILFLAVIVLIIGGMWRLDRQTETNAGKPVTPPPVSAEAPEKPPERRPEQPPPVKQPPLESREPEEEEDQESISVREDLPQQKAGQQKSIKFSETLKKENKTYEITPGLTLKPGEGVSVKFSEEQKEEIILKKDRTAPNSQYQMLWQRKY